MDAYINENEKANQNIPSTSNSKSSLQKYTFSEDFLTFLQCILCKQISKEPRILSCCAKMACNYCFKNSIEFQTQCLNPLCKSPSPKLLSPSPLVLNIYSHFKIKCPYSSKGCIEEIPFTKVEDHDKHCEYNPNGLKKCDKCLLYFEKSKLVSHDCVSELLSGIDNISKEIAEIKSKQSADTVIDTVYRIKHSLKIHEHPLVQVTRSAWSCNTCRSSFGSSSTSYYCHPCDFDCCANCFDFSFKKKENTNVHPHPLTQMYDRNGYTCNMCSKAYNYLCVNWRCYQCNFNQCFFCRFK